MVCDALRDANPLPDEGMAVPCAMAHVAAPGHADDGYEGDLDASLEEDAAQAAHTSAQMEAAEWFNQSLEFDMPDSGDDFGGPMFSDSVPSTPVAGGARSKHEACKHG